MASIKEYNRKLVSLKNTSKITRTMKMVSVGKLRRAQDAQRKAWEYALEVNKLVHRISATVDEGMHPLLTRRAENRKLHVVLMTSDKGLCGGFNNNIIRFTHNWIREQEAAGKQVTMSCCGRRGYAGFKASGRVVHHYENVTARPDTRNARNIAEDLSAAFIRGDYDEVVVINNLFISPLSQKPSVHPLLPLAPSEFHLDGDLPDASREFIAEPGLGNLLNQLIPELVIFKVYFAFLENAAGEHGARMTAMDNATKNAQELIDKTTLLRNRARQAAITTELIEIISGAEAL